MQQRTHTRHEIRGQDLQCSRLTMTSAGIKGATREIKEINETRVSGANRDVGRVSVSHSETRSPHRLTTSRQVVAKVPADLQASVSMCVCACF